MLAQFVVERAEIFPAARGELGWQFVAGHDLAVLVFLKPFARFNLGAQLRSRFFVQRGGQL